MSRAVSEWIAAHPDQAVPPRVRLRVWERCGGRCALSGRKIMPGEPWQADHIVAVINGGEHRESNLQVVSVDAHKAKTRLDVAIKSKVARIKAKHLGVYPKSKARIVSRGFTPTRRQG